MTQQVISIQLGFNKYWVTLTDEERRNLIANNLRDLEVSVARPQEYQLHLDMLGQLSGASALLEEEQRFLTVIMELRARGICSPTEFLTEQAEIILSIANPIVEPRIFLDSVKSYLDTFELRLVEQEGEGVIGIRPSEYTTCHPGYNDI